MGRDRPGRGAWLCRDSPECIERAAKRKAFDRAFRSRVEDSHLEQLRTCSGIAARARSGTGLGRSGPVMCEDRGSYVRIGTYDVKEGQ